MIVRCLYDKLVSVHELKSHPKNRNKHPEEQIKRLAEILKYQGWRYPIKVSNRSGFITTGHGRLEAAKLNGWDTVPINFQEYDSEEQEYADVQADNAIALWSEMDLLTIKKDLEDFPAFNEKLLGIKNLELINKEEKTPSKVSPEDLAEQYIVCIYLKSEPEMQEIYQEILERGFECKLIT